MISYPSLRILFKLSSDRRGLALIEFAFTLPILLTMVLSGAEITNYIIVRMRVSQLALQIADNAARMGNGTMLQLKTLNEADINDLFAGANLQSGILSLQTKGRVILSDLEPQTTSDSNSTYKIKWQRCYGTQPYTSPYPGAGAQNLSGLGPAGNQTIAQQGNATMFVELYYVYTPLVSAKLVPSTTITEIASMSVRDRRDLTGGDNGVYPVSGASKASC
ncbi:TadE/TadG family type IV pilus assembly protein [Sphingomonas mollis]|uniref:Pilus assembly protein n=1 Tax=Sphingomonas mollis TaxID=2795726 RepID=A0ABS0XTW0_9SPHN|nr:TadE family protein [Sphingomonas sp. BT553]MBJ6123479.1 pilus assembly protein [Sphingomonas sp. BT553]